MERTKMPNLRNGSKGGFDHSNPGSLDCESGIRPLSYHADEGNETKRKTKVKVVKQH